MKGDPQILLALGPKSAHGYKYIWMHTGINFKGRDLLFPVTSVTISFIRPRYVNILEIL